MHPPAAPEISRKFTRIYIVGPSSTGKTTVCNALAQRLGLGTDAFVTEVARQVIKALGLRLPLSREDIGLVDMQKAIMLAHLEREDVSENSNSAVQLCDRSAVDPIVYAVFTAENAADAQARKRALVDQPQFQKALPLYRDAVFVLLAPVQGWMVDDGFRHVGDQTEVLSIFRDTLAELGIKYREIGPEMRFLPERVSTILGLAML
ncbi:AAA domain-containing protein [Mycena rebaudengoi]|nr:AAA domain-containing protein [Mycena rebaudengoi]